MNILKVYKGLLNVAWYVIIIALVGVGLHNMHSLLVNRELATSSLFSIPFRVELVTFDVDKLKNDFFLQAIEPAAIFLEINKINLSRFTEPFIIFYLFSGLTFFCLIFFQPKLFRDLIGDVIKRNIFTRENVDRLRLLAF